jgi:hypothetical protein
MLPVVAAHVCEPELPPAVDHAKLETTIAMLAGQVQITPSATAPARKNLCLSTGTRSATTLLSTLAALVQDTDPAWAAGEAGLMDGCGLADFEVTMVR